MTAQLTCKQRVRAEYQSRMATITELVELDRKDPEASTEDGQNWREWAFSVATIMFNVGINAVRRARATSLPLV